MYAALGTLVGLLTGSASTYFFTQSSVESAQKQTALAGDLAKTAASQSESLRSELVRQQNSTATLTQKLLSAQDELHRISIQNPAVKVDPKLLQRFELDLPENNDKHPVLRNPGNRTDGNN